MSIKNNFIVIIAIVAFLSLVFILWPKIFSNNKENFINSIDQYFQSLKTGINTANLNEFDNIVANPHFIDDYNNTNLLIFKRCYNVKDAFAEELLNNNLPYTNLLLPIFDSNTNIDLCIHKFIKYTSDFGEISSSISNDITNFYNCKNKQHKIKGDVYVLFGQIPYLKNDNDHSMSVQFNNDTQSYTSYASIDSDTQNVETNGPTIYVYYIIYSNYKSNYKLISDDNTFDKTILPTLEKYASKDNACNTKSNTGYLAGCVSTKPLYNTNEANNGPGTSLNKHISSVSKDLLTNIKDITEVDYNNIYNQIDKSTKTSSGVLSCPNSKTTIATALNIPASSLDMATSFINSPFETLCIDGSIDKNIYVNKLPKDVSAYSARCTNDKGTESTDGAVITNYLTLYFVNKRQFIISNNGSVPEYMFDVTP